MRPEEIENMLNSMATLYGKKIMMTPEMLGRLQSYIVRLSDDGLTQMAALVISEIVRRGRLKKGPPPSPPVGSLRACDPDQED